MGERTSAAMTYRTSIPQNSLAANPGSLECGTNRSSSGIPDVVLKYERQEARIDARKIADLLLQKQSGEGLENIRSLLTHQPAYKAVLNMPEFHFEAIASPTVYGTTSMVVDQQPAANCCPSLPCNLL